PPLSGSPDRIRCSTTTWPSWVVNPTFTDATPVATASAIRPSTTDRIRPAPASRTASMGAGRPRVRDDDLASLHLAPPPRMMPLHRGRRDDPPCRGGVFGRYSAGDPAGDGDVRARRRH